MNPQDENIRAKVNDALTANNVDVRNLAIEVANGSVFIRGSVSSTDQQERVASALRRAVDRSTPVEWEVGVLPVAPTDSLDGRGRSPLTGTSADSAHESRHQLDRD
jgi:hypothetical protein